MLRDDAGMATVREDAAQLAKYQPVVDAPPRLVIPSLAAATSTALLLMAIRRQHFMLLPTAIVMCELHRDALVNNQTLRNLFQVDK